MNQYMSDSMFTDLDPRTLVLDAMMQAREPELIKKAKLREAQVIKLAQQTDDILEDLLQGGTINVPIEVFEVGAKRYVVDGFHRTTACLEYLKKRPNESFTIRAKVIKNRTYEEAFLAAQGMNETHGVSATKQEVMQSKFRKLIVAEHFELSISEIMETAKLKKTQAAHTRHALLACKEVIDDIRSYKSLPLAERIESLHRALKDKYDLTASAFDGKSFPLMRVLADAYNGKDNLYTNGTDEWTKQQMNGAERSFKKMIEHYGAGIFREALRKVAREEQLDISVTRKASWEAKNGYTEEADYEENSNKPSELIMDELEF